LMVGEEWQSFVVTFYGRGGVTTVLFDGTVVFDGGGGVAAVPLDDAVTINSR